MVEEYRTPPSTGSPSFSCAPTSTFDESLVEAFHGHCDAEGDKVEVGRTMKRSMPSWMRLSVAHKAEMEVHGLLSFAQARETWEQRLAKLQRARHFLERAPAATDIERAAEAAWAYGEVRTHHALYATLEMDKYTCTTGRQRNAQAHLAPTRAEFAAYAQALRETVEVEVNLPVELYDSLVSQTHDVDGETVPLFT
ncbi:hypothetical protein DFH09DRAFT_1337486 [Mycena vulgaris]|nr:hypothetical protein DFH09DRAFT_1337486 [Mycena vulgaris]